MYCRSAFRSMLRDSPWRMANEAAYGFATLAGAAAAAVGAGDELRHEGKSEESFAETDGCLCEGWTAEAGRGGVANTERGLGLLWPTPTVWLSGVVDEAFRLTVMVDVAEDDRLCMPGNLPPPWNRADGEYCFEGNGAHAETMGEPWADSGTLVTSLGDTAFKNEAPGAGSELDNVLVEDVAWKAEAPVDDALLGELRVGEDVAYEIVVLDSRSLEDDLVGEAPARKDTRFEKDRVRAPAVL